MILDIIADSLEGTRFQLNICADNYGWIHDEGFKWQLPLVICAQGDTVVMHSQGWKRVNLADPDSFGTILNIIKEHEWIDENGCRTTNRDSTDLQ